MILYSASPYVPSIEMIPAHEDMMRDSVVIHASSNTLSRSCI